MKNLQEVRNRMIEIVGKPEKLGFVNARLVLRTGITLSDTQQALTSDELGRVIKALQDMGYAIDSHGGRA
jgi:hypothetical protein